MLMGGRVAVALIAGALAMVLVMAPISATADCSMTQGQVFSGQYEDQSTNSLIANLKVDVGGHFTTFSGMQS